MGGLVIAACSPTDHHSITLVAHEVACPEGATSVLSHSVPVHSSSFQGNMLALQCHTCCPSSLIVGSGVKSDRPMWLTTQVLALIAGDTVSATVAIPVV